MSRVYFSIPWRASGDEHVYIGGRRVPAERFRIDVRLDQCEILDPIKDGERVEIFRPMKIANFTVEKP